MSKVPSFSVNFKENNSSTISYNKCNWETHNIEHQPERGFCLEIKVIELSSLENTWGLQLGVTYPEFSHQKWIGANSGVGYIAFNGKIGLNDNQGEEYGEIYGKGMSLRNIKKKDQMLELIT
eukprot:TRINITY_DN697_c0_g1_i5.p1 TRINITY_DN697_c0_g1~~TRINITY_DN697_c0_g1_i5.p1  ORF type:complete len:122 (+),score=30.26 TRINITY_DN697_c0_g1_i5:93-458(+)